MGRSEFATYGAQHSRFSIDRKTPIVTIGGMKITLQIQILPDTDQTAKLKAIMERFNEAANWVVGELFAGKVTNKIEAQHLCYREVREGFGLGSQTAIL